MQEIVPFFAVDGVVNTESAALRAKSPEPPSPLTIWQPPMCVELTLPSRSTSSAVLTAMTPRRRITSGELLISTGRRMILYLYISRLL